MYEPRAPRDEKKCIHPNLAVRVQGSLGAATPAASAPIRLCIHAGVGFVAGDCPARCPPLVGAMALAALGPAPPGLWHPPPTWPLACTLLGQCGAPHTGHSTAATRLRDPHHCGVAPSARPRWWAW